jgi:hypothetical protein
MESRFCDEKVLSLFDMTQKAGLIVLRKPRLIDYVTDMVNGFHGFLSVIVN